MKDNELLFDRKSHVLYSKPCKKEILAKIALHYPEAERETVWEKVQRQYAVFLSDWRTDLGGKRSFHNGVGGAYDCIAIMSYYAVCKAVTSFCEIEENLILPSFRKLKFVDCNKLFWQKLMYKAFLRAKAGCDKWHDYEMTRCPYHDECVRYGCPELCCCFCGNDGISYTGLHPKLIWERSVTLGHGNDRCDFCMKVKK